MSKRGVNKVILVGHLGQDPEVRYMPNGEAVANVSLATSEEWKDKSTQEIKSQTEWHRIVVFGKLAEIVGEYLRKGSQVYFEGKLKTRKWTDAQNIERYTTEIVCDEMQMLGGKPADGQTAKPAANQAPANAAQGNQRPAPAQRPDDGTPQGGYQQRPAQSPQQGGFDTSVLDDEIPF